MVVLSKLSEVSSSSSTHGHIYDVFLSFRGLDTRNSFTAYLHKALIDANITTFLDDEEIETGEDLNPDLKRAIIASRASIIVLSKNYANSSWCLDELVLILKQHKKSNQIVIPVFCHVEPTHVRKQQSSFGDAMAKYRQMMEAETIANKRSEWAQKIERWNKALTEVADLKGVDVNGRLEMEIIEEIVKDIYHRLHIPLRTPLPLLIGMENSIAFVTSWLKDSYSHTEDILTILGTGGIGKTSLAKYVYWSHFHEFDTSSYVADVSRRCDQFNGLLELQKQLCDDILKTSSIQHHDVSIYTAKIESAFARKKVFLILDDIYSVHQLDALLGNKKFHPGSKIIITTKHSCLTESCALFKKNIKPKHTKHLLGGLHETASRKLFCFHAFMCNTPKAGYEELSERYVRYCEGHPLALEVLGKSLHNRDLAYWEDMIKQIKKETASPVNNVLRMSFDSLPSENDKELFKHIACFFVGMDRDVTEIILKACDINTRFGITNLIDRNLLSVGWNNRLMMHRLVQEMGRFVVREESPAKPWKRSRLWCNEESFKVLKQKKGKRNIIGLSLDMQMLEKEKLCASFELKTDALSNMDNLMLLQLSYVQINGSYMNFPEELRWLCMHGFSLKSIPSDLAMENVVALDLSYSNIESFDICYSNPQRLQKRQKQPDGSCLKDKRLLRSLKILNLSFCDQLRSLGSFDHLPALERLILKQCIGLLDVCESIEQCHQLVLVDMSYCNKLNKLPRIMRMLKNIKTLLVEGCNLRESRMKNIDMDSPEMLKANSIINTETSSLAIVEVIPSDFKLFAISLPRCLVKLSLADNNLSTQSFPMDFSCLSMLAELYLDTNPIVSLPSCVRSLPRIETLGMSNCNMLTSVEHPPHTLTYLDLYSYHNKQLLRKVVFDPQMSPLEFSISRVFLPSASFEIEGMVKIQPMTGVEEKLLRNLGWSKLDFLNRRYVGTSTNYRETEKSEMQMYYEFGIFSTIYGGEEMPNWITNISTRSSISFTIPSSSNNFTGLNFCYVRAPLLVVQSSNFQHERLLYLPMIRISNITKNRTWIYIHYVVGVNFGRDPVIFLSHWMFGLDEMEVGDHVTITIDEPTDVIKECGVRFMYDDGEDDALSYYKSWNHIIGGELTGFQSTTGEYILSKDRILYSHLVTDIPKYDYWCKKYICFKDKVKFRAFSQRKSRTY